MTDLTLPSLNRRTVLGVSGAAAALLPSAAKSRARKAAPETPPPSHAEVTLTVNGHDYRVALDPRTTLLDALREHLQLTGSKKGCDHGQCGACTVHVDGKRVLACLTLALAAEGRPVTTIEGLSKPGDPLHPMQQAFIDHDGFQCGYCTPGQIMSAVACVQEGHAATDDQIRESMSGNLCRCGAYPHIVEAVRDGAAKVRRPG